MREERGGLTNGFLSGQQRLSISLWQRHSLEGGSSGGGLGPAAPCVASFPLLIAATTGNGGLWELPALSLQRHDNMQGSIQSRAGSPRGGLSARTTPFTHLDSQMINHHTW